MRRTGAASRRRSEEDTNGRHPRPARAAAAAATAALCTLAGCATPAPAPDPAALQAEIEAGLDLYEAGEYALAAQRFRGVADAAAHDADTRTRALVAECTAWLRAGHTRELADCTARLEPLQMRQPRSDPGVNTLLALGAVAGGRPLPRLRIPNAVQPFVAGTVEESR